MEIMDEIKALAESFAAKLKKFGLNIYIRSTSAMCDLNVYYAGDLISISIYFTQDKTLIFYSDEIGELRSYHDYTDPLYEQKMINIVLIYINHYIKINNSKHELLAKQANQKCRKFKKYKNKIAMQVAKIRRNTMNRYLIVSDDRKTKRNVSKHEPNVVAAINRPFAPVRSVCVYNAKLECVYMDPAFNIEYTIDSSDKHWLGGE